MRKRGWNDELSGTLESQKKKEAMLSRSEIQTMFQFIDADEGRLVNDKHINGYSRPKVCHDHSIAKFESIRRLV